MTLTFKRAKGVAEVGEAVDVACPQRRVEHEVVSTAVQFWFVRRSKSPSLEWRAPALRCAPVPPSQCQPRRCRSATKTDHRSPLVHLFAAHKYIF